MNSMNVNLDLGIVEDLYERVRDLCERYDAVEEWDSSEEDDRDPANLACDQNAVLGDVRDFLDALCEGIQKGVVVTKERPSLIAITDMLTAYEHDGTVLTYDIFTVSDVRDAIVLDHFEFEADAAALAVVKHPRFLREFGKLCGLCYDKEAFDELLSAILDEWEDETAVAVRDCETVKTEVV